MLSTGGQAPNLAGRAPLLSCPCTRTASLAGESQQQCHAEMLHRCCTDAPAPLYSTRPACTAIGAPEAAGMSTWGDDVPRRWTLALLAAGCATALPLASWGQDAARQSAENRAVVYLKGLPREWSGTSDRDCKTYEEKNIDKLSKPFALSAAHFLRAFVEVHGAVTITSAYRSEEEQACVCVGEKGPCAGRPHVLRKKKHRPIVVRSVSHHQLGIALDVRAGTGSEDEFICLHEFAELNPQFGVRFPFGKQDYPHMEPGTARGPLKMASLASADSIVTPCKRMKIMLTDAPAD